MADQHPSSELSIRQFFRELRSPDAATDLVSASAVAAGLGAALLARVATLPKTRSDSLEDRQALDRAAEALAAIEEQLVEAIDVERAVKVYAARNMPQADASQRAARAAADVPLEVMRLAAAGLQHARTVAIHGSPAARGDTQLAVALLQAGSSGARTSLEAKLTSLTDAVYTAEVVGEIARLSEEAALAARAADLLTAPPPA
jgi:formiminotetrahydrofolate cyclodeaminase